MIGDQLQQWLIRAWITLALAVAADAAPPQIETGTVVGEPNQLVEIRVVATPPAGSVVLSQEWLVVDPIVDWRQYEDGRVFVSVAPAGSTYRVHWRVTYVDWEAKTGSSDSRVYTVTISGPPQPPPDVKPPPTMPDPTTPDTEVRKVTYVYRPENQIVPRQIQAALRKLEEAGIEAAAIDQEIRDGNGQVPAQHRGALSAASSVPCLVIETADRVIKVIESPTENDVMNYAK